MKLSVLLARIKRGIDYLEDGFLTLLLLSMIIIAALQILSRNVLDSGVVWADPLLRVLVLWVALVGAIIASRKNEHITIDVLSRFLPPAVYRYITIILHLFTGAVTGLLAYHSWRFVEMEREFETMAFASIPAWMTEIILPVAFGIIALRYLFLASTELRAIIKGTPVS
jgi:TRAP-type C4-dicarboxylate transport system permease small subunit